MGLIERSCLDLIETLRAVREAMLWLTEAATNPDCEKFGEGTPWPFYVHKKVRRQSEKNVRPDELAKILKKVGAAITADPYRGKRLHYFKVGGEVVYRIRFSKYRCLYTVRKTGPSTGYSLILLIDDRGDVYDTPIISVPACP